MERTIKFRAWNGESMTYNVSLPYDEENCEIMQFTGLTDSQGKEIYEGDVIDCRMRHNEGSLPHRGKIVYHESFGAFATENHGGKTLIHNHLLKTFEVVGNIYEHKNLLK